MSFRSKTKPFELKRLQMISSDPPISNFMGGQHVVNSCCLKLRFLGEMTIFKACFSSVKIAVIQAKSVFHRKKSIFSNLKGEDAKLYWWIEQP